MYNILPTHGISQLAGTCTDTKEIIWPKRHENSYKCTLHLERSKTKKNLWDPRLKFICPFGQTFFLLYQYMLQPHVSRVAARETVIDRMLELH